MVPPVPLDPLLAGLRARGLVLGVATNDAQDVGPCPFARRRNCQAFRAVLGFDSGYTPKPAPDMLLGPCRPARGLPPESVAMVGDSTHDLLAGRARGWSVSPCLTGMADEAALAPYADLVLPDHRGNLPIILPKSSRRCRCLAAAQSRSGKRAKPAPPVRSEPLTILLPWFDKAAEPGELAFEA